MGSTLIFGGSALGISFIGGGIYAGYNYYKKIDE